MNSLIGKGWSFPLKPNSNGELKWADGNDKVRQSIWLILSTAPGERVMLPSFGCGIHDLTFEANTSSLRGLLREKVREALVQWEPRIDVVEVRVEVPPEGRNHLLIRVDYRLRTNNAFYNLVYPFFLSEGVN
ncbi:GPW/gp25 family protein [Agarilytica rhodophyticola]|uniref:GPW/gp25 family protein n=1 Tax=Agarilytica rhodophyticola TaxID=1737490 RepID=UPI001C1F44A3|nr:GPW/gp25 family protein [Agarilytica rhodophyticola]